MVRMVIRPMNISKIRMHFPKLLSPAQMFTDMPTLPNADVVSNMICSRVNCGSEIESSRMLPTISPMASMATVYDLSIRWPGMERLEIVTSFLPFIVAPMERIRI